MSFGLKTRFVDAGLSSSMAGGRMGRGTRLPVQFGQAPIASAHGAQNVHS
jgi:hypothetical protein